LDPNHPPRVFFHEFTPGVFSIQFIDWYMPTDRFEQKLNRFLHRAKKDRILTLPAAASVLG